MSRGVNAPRLLSVTGEQKPSEPVECLGRRFASEDERRNYYLDRLREQLPELRKRPDFPKGADEDILRMSDPPWYTACPNPFLEEFVRCHGRPYDPEEPYHREPFAVDVSVGKTDALYRAHGYHTKVPHLAIVPSILHYTKPGDVVLDGFCGSGMTGVAAQWCGTAPAEYRRKLEAEWNAAGREAPEWGARRAILGDLSPAATFIAANYNIPFDVEEFAEAAQKLLDEVEEEVGWMYETTHTDGAKGRINYTVWSEVFSCPECAAEIVFLEEALDRATGRIRPTFPCPACVVSLEKKRLQRLNVARHDPALERTVKDTKRVPVFIDFTADGVRRTKTPDDADRILLRRIADLPPPTELPTDRMMHVSDEVEAWGDEWRSGVARFTHLHHLFLPRAGIALATLWTRAQACSDSRTRARIQFLVEQAIAGMSLQNRYSPTHYSQVNRYMAGRIRVLSQHAECTPDYILRGKLKRITKALAAFAPTANAGAVTSGDCARLAVPEDSVDYIFTDPPFGDNLAYAELNFLTEAFHGVFTNRSPEAIISPTQEKSLLDYQRLMRRCFAEYCRLLKPGRWMTVVFHNSKNTVWNSIQEALLSAGFVVADVRILDKQAGTFNQVNTSGAVEKDLVISAYKPNDGLEGRFRVKAGTEDGAWDFVRTHLRQLPVLVEREGRIEVMLERQGFLLFDRMVAFHVQRNVAVPVSASDFYLGLRDRFPERDGMFFLPDQVTDYDRKRMRAKGLFEQGVVVRDEETAIRWLRIELGRKPQTFQEIHPAFIREIAGWLKHERPLELSMLLEQNFLPYDGVGEVPGPIHSHLSTAYKDLRNLPKNAAVLRQKAQDRWYVPDPRKAPEMEQLRERALLREFAEYAGKTTRRLRVVRLEAVRAGFRAAWRQKDYATIVAVARKLPENVLHEDPKLLMWFDQAETRIAEA